MVDLKGEYVMHFLCLNDLVSLGAVCILFFTVWMCLSHKMVKQKYV